MILSYSGLAAALFAAMSSPLLAAGSTHVERIRNDRVIVTEYSLVPGDSIAIEGRLPEARVYFADAAFEVTPRGGAPRSLTVKRGDVVFNMPQARTVKNAGSTEARFFRVEFTGKGSQDSWGTTGLSPNYVMLFENLYARAYHVRIPAGTREPQHTHHDRVVVCLNGAEVEHLFPDGRKESSRLKTGEVAFRAGSTHIGRNIGKTDLWVIAIEPK
jgi:hypothetical protein